MLQSFAYSQDDQQPLAIFYKQDIPAGEPPTTGFVKQRPMKRLSRHQNGDIKCCNTVGKLRPGGTPPTGVAHSDRPGSIPVEMIFDNSSGRLRRGGGVKHDIKPLKHLDMDTT